MKDHLDILVERTMEKRSMPLADFIRTENLQDYELGYEDILYADAINVATIPHEEYMILVRDRWDDATHAPVAEYAIYSQEDHDGRPLLNSLNMNATYHLVKVCHDSFRNMASAISEADSDIYNIDLENEAVVRDMTDGDPLADLTHDDAVRLIAEAKDIGYEVPANLTPELFLSIYENLKPEEEE